VRPEVMRQQDTTNESRARRARRGTLSPPTLSNCYAPMVAAVRTAVAFGLESETRRTPGNSNGLPRASPWRMFPYSHCVFSRNLFRGKES